MLKTFLILQQFQPLISKIMLSLISAQIIIKLNILKTLVTNSCQLYKHDCGQVTQYYEKKNSASILK